MPLSVACPRSKDQAFTGGTSIVFRLRWRETGGTPIDRATLCISWFRRTHYGSPGKITGAGEEKTARAEIAKFIRIGVETFASKKGTNKYFYHNNHLGADDRRDDLISRINALALPADLKSLLIEIVEGPRN